MGDETYRESARRRFQLLAICSLAGATGIAALVGVLGVSTERRIVQGGALLLAALFLGPVAVRKARTAAYVKVAKDGVHGRDWLNGEWFVAWGDIREISVGLDDNDGRAGTSYRFPLLELANGTARRIMMLASAEYPIKPMARKRGTYAYDRDFDRKISDLRARLEQHRDATTSS